MRDLSNTVNCNGSSNQKAVYGLGNFQMNYNFVDVIAFYA
jgi:hypothetical protein